MSPNTPKSEAENRQKRVLPSRSRRGGPGIGSCDVDLMILETYKRRPENEPLIPADTQFLLTTNSSLVPTASSSAATLDIDLNTQANERYFDRPEVLKSFKEQQIIQTPEFSLLSEDGSVGGRFRPRGIEDEGTDTSDAAYEKRHRKYETFEKRQRLREKEKLKHEQYKLKERIDQLRAMDGAAFLALPSTSFPSAPNHASEDSDSGQHANGSSNYNEGEWRRKEMLEVAQTLEERYRVLLPPDRKYLEREKKLNGQSDSHTSVEPESVKAGKVAQKHYSDHESEAEPYPEQKREMLKLKIRFPARKPVSVTPLSVPDVSRRRISSPPPPISAAPTTRRSGLRFSSASSYHLPKSPVNSSSLSHFQSNFGDQPTSPIAAASPAQHVVYLEPEKQPSSPQFEERSVSPVRRRKRRRVSVALSDQTASYDQEPSTLDYDYDSAALSPLASISRHSHQPTSKSAPKKREEPCALMITALRNSGTNARHTNRHVTAFGVKLHAELEILREYEIPSWIYPGQEDEEVDELNSDADDDEMGDYEEVAAAIQTSSEADGQDAIADVRDVP